MKNERSERVAFARLRIDLIEPDKTPIRENTYYAGAGNCDLEKKETNKKQAEGVREAANTEWASLAAFAPKKNRPVCFRVDFWKLDAVIVRDSQPVQRMNKFIDSFGDLKNICSNQCQRWLLSYRTRRRCQRQDRFQHAWQGISIQDSFR